MDEAAAEGVSGAQPADALLAALSRAWTERPPETNAAPGRARRNCARVTSEAASILLTTNNSGAGGA